MQQTWDFIKDSAKLAVRRALVRLTKQKPAIELLFAALEVEGYRCRDLSSLEVFGKHGLWHTTDYLHRCRSVDLWEIDPVSARHARRLGPKVRVFCDDSIKAVQNHDARLGRYDTIVIDNQASPFDDWCEHFDLFPEILRCLEPGGAGVLIVNFIRSHRSDLAPPRARMHECRRVAFYGKSSVTSREAVQTYQRHAAGLGLKIETHVTIPRNELVSYLGMVVTPAASGRASEP